MADHVIVLGSAADARVAEVTGRLTAAGYAVMALVEPDRAEHYTADLVILSADEPESAAVGCGMVRRHPSLKKLPLLLLVPRGLAAGIDPELAVDEVLLAPWSPEELLLRLSLARRRRGGAALPHVLRVGDIAIDSNDYTVRLHGEAIDMTLKEYELLSYLAANPGRVFTRAALLNSVWGYEYFGGTRTVDVHIRRLRAKLGDWGEEMIQTVRGVGYRFSSDYGRRQAGGTGDG